MKTKSLSIIHYQLSIILKCEPLPQSRPRFAQGRVYETAQVKAYKRQLGYEGLRVMAGRQPLTGALSVKITIYRKYKATSRRYGDFDNHAKAILDALNGICFVDDSQVVKAEIEKVQSPEEGVEVIIENV